MFKQKLIHLAILFTVSSPFFNSLWAGEWREASSLNTPRYGAAAVVLDGYIYVLGGATTNGVILNSVERYDPAAGVWEAGAVKSFEEQRLDAAAIVFQNRIYLMGGLEDEGEVLKKVEVYDPAENEWEDVENMQRDRRGHVAVLLNSTICVMGGQREGGNYTTEIEYYESENWMEAPSAIISARVNPFAVSVNNIFYMFGGILNFPSDQVYIGQPDTEWQFNWSEGPRLQTPRGNGAVVVLGDSIFIMGGITSNTSATNLVERYSISTGQLETGTPLATARIGMTAVVLDSVIYVIGGYVNDPNQPLSLVEVYDRVTGIELPGGTGVPTEFAQIIGYPNPFNGLIQLEIRLPRAGQIELAIFDIQGRKIVTLHNGVLSAGQHLFGWSARDALNVPVASGIYLAVLKGESNLKMFKVSYVK